MKSGVVVTFGGGPAAAAWPAGRHGLTAPVRGVVVTLWRERVRTPVRAWARALRGPRSRLAGAWRRLSGRGDEARRGGETLLLSPPGRLLRIGQAMVLRSGRRG